MGISYFWKITPYGISGRWSKLLTSIEVMIVKYEQSDYVLEITNLTRMARNIWSIQFTRYSYRSKLVRFDCPMEKQKTNMIKMMNNPEGSQVLMVESCKLWTLKSKLWTSWIWTLIHLINNFVCAKSLKLITLEKNIFSIQQLPLCLPLFFVFSSEVLNSGIKSTNHIVQ